MLLGLLLTAAQCPPALQPLDDGCAVVPQRPTAHVVYFHGMLPADTDWSRVPELSLLGVEAKRRGVALLALRGEAGLCAWSPDVTTHWCWPNDLTQRGQVGRVLERVQRALSRLGLWGPPVYAGFSNGGYLVTLIASESEAEAQAYAVMHAGNVTGQVFDARRARPTLLLGATRDTYQLPGMKRLRGLLEAVPWPVRWTMREGGHALTAADARALFDFVEAQRR